MRKILVTGGAGFLGRAIARHYHNDSETQITVYSRDEEKQWRLKQSLPDTHCILGSIYDTESLTHAIIGHDIVLHLAAHKFVPEAEHNVWDAVRANVDGTMAVAQACIRARVQNAVFISTDKACDPVNTYGLTKALGERIWLEADARIGGGVFSVARYGNVIGSTGSAMPVMLNSIRLNGRIDLTDTNMTRFFMSVENAIKVIEESMCHPGKITVPIMSSATLPTVAQACVIISGRHDVDIKIIGPRPGEKTHEQIISSRELDRICTFDGNFAVINSEIAPKNESYKDSLVAKSISSKDCINWNSDALARKYQQITEADNVLR